MRATAIVILSHLDADEIIRAEQNVLVRIKNALAVDGRKLANLLLRKSNDATIESLRARGQRPVARDLRIRDADARATIDDGPGRELKTVCEREMLLCQRHHRLASPIDLRPRAFGIDGIV